MRIIILIVAGFKQDLKDIVKVNPFVKTNFSKN